MREIKFRGKTSQGEWVYGDLIHYRENDIRILEQNNGDWDILEAGIEVIPETVGQFTGRLDTKQKKIFEGDVAKFWDDCRHTNGTTYKKMFVGAVKWVKHPTWNLFCYCIISDETTEYTRTDRIGFGRRYQTNTYKESHYANVGDGCEIIGNIHEGMGCDGE